MPADHVSLDDWVARIRSTISKAPGAAAPRVRTQALERARAHGRIETPTDDLVPLVADFVDAIATDPRQADLDQLLANGSTEDEVFELAIAAAVGAGVARFEAGIEALRKADES